ncbi:MAG: hypothetical protein ABIJ41_00675 [Candidatus Omnitrophota bacterium]
MSKSLNIFSWKGFIIFALVASVFALNVWINHSLERKDSSSVEDLENQKQSLPIALDQAKSFSVPGEVIHSGNITKKSQVIRGLDTTEEVFYEDDREVGRQKVSPKGVTEQTGTIPDGPVKFVDHYRHTYGEEFYRRGKKHGPSKEYYENGQIRKEMEYNLGELHLAREFNKDGSLLYEVDYRDALDCDGKKEVGIGKLFYDDGSVRFEWNLTKMRRTGYKRAYDRQGHVTYEAEYDRYCDQIN